MNSVLAFSTLAMLCSLYLVLKHFHHLQRQSDGHPDTVSHSSLPCSPWKQPVCALSLWIYFFWVFHINGIIYLSFCI